MESLPKVWLGRLQREVEVVAHDNIAMKFPALAANNLNQCLLEGVSRTLRPEHVPAVVSAIEDVVEPAFAFPT